MDDKYIYHISVTFLYHGSRSTVWQFDMTEDGVNSLLVRPFKEQKRIICDGNVIPYENIEEFKIYATDFGVDDGSEPRDDMIGRVLEQGSDANTYFLTETLANTRFSSDLSMEYDLTSIFIVHGHDTTAKLELARLIENQLGLKAIILHEQPNRGQTIIEKLERHSRGPGFVFVLLTPDDLGGIRPSKDKDLDIKPRARQNVIFELGYFVGKLGRGRVCCLHTGDVEIPSDMHGVMRLPYEKSVTECFQDIIRELKHTNYQINIK